ncbi:MAG TPA: DUF4331 family protein [Candidatus Polarisedimenticolaceae bacterium]|nr:DUF4331 family protein [Candidatus Polarisedimenticolaceae bacterium]
MNGTRWLAACVTRATLAAVLLAEASGTARASDHSDAPILGSVTRVDANITDLHVFVVGPNLVLALSTNPAIPPSATSYVFPSDVTFELNIDVDSPVSPVDLVGDGGTVLEPGRIHEEITFRVRFKEDGSPIVQRVQRAARTWATPEPTTLTSSRSDRNPPAQFAPRSDGGDDESGFGWWSRRTESRSGRGTPLSRLGIASFFAGLRDDPFIRTPRAGRNVAAIVIEVPLDSIARDGGTWLVWATSQVEEMDGSHQEMAGRSLRSMFSEQNALNGLHPRDHLRVAGMRPDVMIFDTARAAAYPNGRALADDVVDLACSLGGECRVANADAPFPTTNDVAFLAEFPYLAPPHLPE